ncbi:spore germination protein GerPB [Thalassobacillus pellis]|uniref:spore germination protein GerPB n=1 Tax=Thalassobacillus pellis TaxID=748008 RepID=UPI00195F7F9C|nr:spore germination protein GerPB [Thalassobacillus pellis]MBM7554091.1 spore germination protein PB [Thalassobacillus pellis]
MGITIHQSICINLLKIGAISNSSVLQIGSAGTIQSRAEMYNTGGYTKPAPPAEPLGQDAVIESAPDDVPLVPLSGPT